MTQTSWVTRTFVAIGVDWYALLEGDGTAAAREELEREAVQLLRDHADHLPSLSTLKRAVARVSFLPSVVEDMWRAAFPPSVLDRASARREWAMLEDVNVRVRKLKDAGDADNAEALRAAAVTFFNKWLADGEDPVEAALRDKARTALRKH